MLAGICGRVTVVQFTGKAMRNEGEGAKQENMSKKATAAKCRRGGV